MTGLMERLTVKKSYANYYKRFERMSKQPAARISGLVSLTIIVTVFFMFFAILPTFRTIATLNREIEDTELLETKLQKKILSLQKAEEVYIQTEKDLEIIAPVLPITQDFERLAWQVNWLPNGFKQIKSNIHRISTSQQAVEFMLFNYGLVDVSVYVTLARISKEQ